MSDEILKKLYYDPKTGFCGINELVRKSGKSKEEVIKFLNSQDVFTLHKPLRKKFPRRKVYVHDIDQQWQADLVEMIPYHKENDGYRYLLTVIDIFSKYAWGIPIKFKNADEVVKAFNKIFKERKPNKIQTDNGTEFYNQKVQNIFKDYNIDHFSTISDLKASIVERFNRTLKEKMWRVFSYYDNKKWINIIDDLLKNYNNSLHSSIKMTPAEASDPRNKEIVHKNLFPENHKYVETSDSEPEKLKNESKFDIGDKVRMSKNKTRLHKGYTPNWTEEYFLICKIFDTDPYTYSIVDRLGEDITGRYYDHDLALYDKRDDIFKVEKIIKTRKKNGIKEHFVKWKGYPDKFNSWIEENQLL